MFKQKANKKSPKPNTARRRGPLPWELQHPNKPPADGRDGRAHGSPQVGSGEQEHPSRSDQPCAARPNRSPLGWMSSTETVSPAHWLISPSYPTAVAWEKAEEHHLALPCSLPAPCPAAASGTTGVERVSSHPRSPISGYSPSSESGTGGCSNSPRGHKQWVSQETFTPSDSFVAFHGWGNRGTAIQQDSLPSHCPSPGSL